MSSESTNVADKEEAMVIFRGQGSTEKRNNTKSFCLVCILDFPPCFCHPAF